MRNGSVFSLVVVQQTNGAFGRDWLLKIDDANALTEDLHPQFSFGNSSIQRRSLGPADHLITGLILHGRDQTQLRDGPVHFIRNLPLYKNRNTNQV